ncbi:hypothetical protein Q8W30_17240 [Neptunomonas phycophila]|uniref:Response regulatory domain-containing protein n=1 Tax=Neptunomonas phycophila TaxID=1572645 RepID=A0ABT9EZU8_9GAMM|nr:hypothetical protein [Neptunomonas phycophila]MDP2524312.1 hypothetical protein [Neptunomonas phycophila]
MNNILVADDEPQKIADVIELLSSIIKADFTESNCFDSTINDIMNNTYDLIILDMSLPTFSGKQEDRGRMRALGGKDILEIMDYEDIKTPVIIFTQFDVFGRNKDIISLNDIHSEISKNFSDFYLGSVMYDSRSSEWKRELIDLLPEGLRSDN